MEISAPVAVGDSTPLTILEMVSVDVEGPAMTKVEKSNLEKKEKNSSLMYFILWVPTPWFVTKIVILPQLANIWTCRTDFY